MVVCTEALHTFLTNHVVISAKFCTCAMVISMQQFCVSLNSGILFYFSLIVGQSYKYLFLFFTLFFNDDEKGRGIQRARLE